MPLTYALCVEFYEVFSDIFILTHFLYKVSPKIIQKFMCFYSPKSKILKKKYGVNYSFVSPLQ